MAEILMRNEVLGGLWELCISVSVVILLLLLIRPVLKRLPRMGMYLLWLMVVLRIAIPYPVSDGIAKLFPEEVSQTVAEVRQKSQPDWLKSRLSARRMAESYGGAENAYRLPPEMVSSDMDVKDVREQSGQETSAATALEIKPEWVLLAAWLFGVLCCVIYLLRSLKANRKYFHDAVHLYDNVYEHPLVCSSFVAGIISPKIFVPVGMKEEDLACVLIHERVHIRRWDYRIKPFAFLMFSVLWFNPLVWLAYRLMMVDMEISCDEAVIRRLGTDARKRYSYLLLTMASGENKISATEVAFGAGVVKERIHHVMKYKKPTKWMSVLLIVAVLLGGCGIASSSPAETTQKLPQGEKGKEHANAIFAEQTVQWEHSDWGDGLEEGAYLEVMDGQGRLVRICELLKGENQTPVSFGKKVFADGEWQKEEISWGKKLGRILNKKNTQTESFVGLNRVDYSASDLYVSMSELQRDTDEKAEEGEEETMAVYAVDQMLYRIHEETGEITELDVPVRKDSDGRVLYNIYNFFADGNYLVYNGISIFALYNGTTGEKIKDLTRNDRVGMNANYGEDYFVTEYFNPDTEQVDLIVMDETGESSYTLPTKIDFDDSSEEQVSYALGVSGSTILLATQKGIFEAEYGEEEFHNVVNFEKDNLYYLTPEGWDPIEYVYKDAKGNYFVSLMHEGEFITCQYERKGL